MPRTSRDLHGRVFGRLTVIERNGSDAYHHPKWLCKCDCGKTRSVLASNLRENGTGATSCGCLSKELSVTRGKKNRKPDSGMGYLFSVYRSSAARRNLSFTVTREQFARLTSSDCLYCGQPPCKQSTSAKAKIPYRYNGIDRVDNEVGYDFENCVPCCSICNRAKHVMSYDHFMAWVSRLTQYQTTNRSFNTCQLAPT